MVACRRFQMEEKLSEIKSDKIKKCPFCGGFGKLLKRNKTVVNGNLEYNCYVTCTKCGARGARFLFKDFESRSVARKVAVDTWNRRERRC